MSSFNIMWDDSAENKVCHQQMLIKLDGIEISLFFNLTWNYLKHGIRTTAQAAGGEGEFKQYGL